jgi:ribosome-associated heat shock protein Hsp15
MRHRTTPNADEPSAAGRVRFDKWLWAARFYKTRSIAAQAIDAGQARLNGERVKPAHGIKAGDVVAVRRHLTEVVADVTAVSERRGPATEAAKLYRETAASSEAREVARLQASIAAGERPSGRPTKRERRRLEDFLNEE